MLSPPPVHPSVFATCTYNSFLFVCFLHDVKNVLKMYLLSSGEELRTFALDVGSVVGFTGRKRDSEIFYYFTSFLSPGQPPAASGGILKTLFLPQFPTPTPTPAVYP